MDTRKLNVRCGTMFAFFYRLFYPTLIMFSSYMVLSGYDAGLVAKMLTLFGVVVIATKPVYAMLLDGGHCRAVVFTLCAVMRGGTLFFFAAQTKTILHAVVYVVTITATASGLMEVIDSWTLKLSAEYGGIDYGKVRSCGSMSFAFVGLVYGSLIAKCGLKAAPVCIYILLAGFAAAAFTLPDPKVVKKENTDTKSSLTELKEIFSDKRLLWFILFYRAGASVIDLTDNYIGVVILEKGGTTAYTGLHDFLKAMIEFFVMFSVSKLIAKHGTLKILCIGMFGLFIKAAARAIMPTPSLVAASCITQAVSFPLVTGAKMQYIKENTDEGHIAAVVTAAGIATTLFCTVVVNPLMSLFIPQTGTRGAMLILSVCGIISAAGLHFALKDNA